MNESPALRPKIFGTGLIALDLVMSADRSEPAHAWAGGTCGNVLAILALLGWDAFPIARLNRDAASQRVRADLKKWGVQLKFASCGPTTDTPIIIQHILRSGDGAPRHRFSWSCPHCGSWLPSFKPVTIKAAEPVTEHFPGTKAFFMDRLSPAALLMARSAADNGAVVIFEPSAKCDENQLAQAVKLAHVIKYSDERFASVPGTMESGSATLVEVQTFGAHGLRYRHRFGTGVSKWSSLDAVQASVLADTCGSGDWCTAGLISLSCAGGAEGLRRGGAVLVDSALRFGQKLAAWNVGFEGARGGMYANERATLERLLHDLAAGGTGLSDIGSTLGRRKVARVTCPACPPQRRPAPSVATTR
ncbi:PfkB family carbohydrate kinase [Methyloversatilis sp. XJ19-13]|uniref:carbohydrate kinase family protein n=1 Tax=Methyloversatilis sp. XJ19-13 TaxID=2963430 RepID=UPI00211CDE00|nr:PfkB family carbohydrate kinase [Methyloversatilis sp. XJ19-13]MCQ9374050.1 PfkB family carbohydrate kinase [Methyloversatilis sp. XJ19-13]